MEKQVVVIAGPTGSGESTITKELIAQCPKSFARLVTATTRDPRPGERHGIDYYFFSKEMFLQKKEHGEMLETTHVPNRDTYYGTYAPDLKEKLEAGFIVIVNLDIVGARFYKKHYNATNIFVMPETFDEIKGRLIRRDPEMSDEALRMRLENARREIDEDKDYYDYTVINKDGCLEQAVEEIITILKKEGYTFR